MKIFRLLFPMLMIVAFCLWPDRTPLLAESRAPDGSLTQTKAIVDAAKAFLASLSPEQRKGIQFDFERPKAASATQFDMASMGRPASGKPPGNKQAESDTTSHRPSLNGQLPRNNGSERAGAPASGEQYGKAIWSNFPVSITKRPGIELGILSVPQRALADRLLKLALSPAGFEKIRQIMGSDQKLADAGTDFIAGKDHYLIGIFGTPEINKPWMIEFGGHHLGLNIVIAGKNAAMTPTLTGAQPAVYTANGKTVRVLAAENDLAFNLINSLGAEEKKKAILNYKIGDLILGPGHDGETIVPEGIKGSALSVKQKQILLDLIREWAGIINSAYQKERLRYLESDLSETYFAWSGPLTHQDGRNGTAYYRIQGPRVIIEFAPQATNGDMDNHVHTIYRDPTNEYGNAYLSK